jgi:hypothetical protein
MKILGLAKCVFIETWQLGAPGMKYQEPIHNLCFLCNVNSLISVTHLLWREEKKHSEGC